MFSNGFDRKDAIFVIEALYVAQPFDSTLLIDNTVNILEVSVGDCPHSPKLGEKEFKSKSNHPLE